MKPDAVPTAPSRRSLVRSEMPATIDLHGCERAQPVTDERFGELEGWRL